MSTPAHRPTVRSLAHALGVSRTTVSEALRNHPRVSPATRERIQAWAKKAGYRFNPLASSVLSDVRRTRLGAFQGVLAAIGQEEPARVPFPGAYWRDLLQGATERSRELGFKVEHFVVGQRRLSVQRLNTILRSRGIRGVLIMPAWNRPDFRQLDWTHLTGVYADYLMELPGLSSVCPDHPRGMELAMGRLQEFGYRRPGLVLIQQESTRLHDRWLAAFLAYRHLHPEIKALPPLILPAMNAECFKQWFRRYRPDVVVGHRAEMIEWMQLCGARVPQTHGFCCLNIGLNARACAGLDQRPYHVGVRAIESCESPLTAGRVDNGLLRQAWLHMLVCCKLGCPAWHCSPKQTCGKAGHACCAWYCCCLSHGSGLSAPGAAHRPSSRL